MTSTTPQRELSRLAAILLLAFFVRVYHCGQLGCISRDGVHFVSFARQLAADPVAAMRATSKQPGYPLLLLGVQRLAGGAERAGDPLVWERCGQAIAVASGVCVVALVYLLARRLFDSFIAIFAGLFACFWPAGVDLSADALSDMPHLALYLAALLWAYRGLVGGRPGWLIAAGATAGLAYWVRQEALGLTIAIVICTWWTARSDKPLQRFARPLLVIAPFVLVVLPQALLTGRVMANKNVWDLLFGEPALSAGRSNSSLLLAHVIPWWMAPGRMAEEWCKSGRYVISTLALAGIFLKSAPRSEATGRRLAMLAIVLQLVAVQLRVKSYGEISSRYLLIPAALSIPWAASGLTAVLSLLSIRLARPGVVSVRWVWPVGLALALMPLVWYSFRPIAPEKSPLREAGLWLREQAASEDRILAHERLEQLIFYSGRLDGDATWIVVPVTATVQEMTERIARDRPAWVVDAKGSRRERIDEKAQFDALAALESLSELKRFGPEPESVHVFRVIGPNVRP